MARGSGATTCVTDDAKPDHALSRARSLHKDAREELGRADTKATTLLSVAGLFLGALSVGAIAGNWTPAALKIPAEPAFWLALALAAWGEVRLLRAVLPRVDHDKAYTEARYFGHVVQMRDREQLRACLEKAATGASAAAGARRTRRCSPRTSPPISTSSTWWRQHPDRGDGDPSPDLVALRHLRPQPGVSAEAAPGRGASTPACAGSHRSFGRSSQARLRGR